MLTWREHLGQLSPQAARTFVDGALRFADSAERERTSPHYLPMFLEPALEVVRTHEELAQEEPNLAQILARRYVDFGELAPARALLGPEALARYADTGSPYAAWCTLQAASLARLDSRLADASRLLAAAERAVDPEAPEHVRLPLAIAGERVATALDLGRVDRMAIELRHMDEESERTGRLWVVEQGIEVYTQYLLLASGRARAVEERARAGIAEVERRVAERAITGRPRWRTNTLASRYELLAGRACLQLGDLARARGWLDRALAEKPVGPEAGEACMSSFERVDALLGLAQVAALEGDAPGALALLDRAARLVAEDLRDGPAGDPPRGWTLEPRIAATRAMAVRIANADRATLARTLEALEHAVRDHLRFWSQTPLEPGGVGFLHLEDRRFVIGQAIELALAVDPEGGARRALSYVLDAEVQGTLARTLGLTAPDEREVVAHLCGERGGVLVLLPATFASHLFLLDASGVAHETLPRLEELRASEANLTRLLDSAQRPPVDGAARALADALLPPAARARIARWETVTVVDHGLLGGAPLEVLPLDDGTPLGIAKPVAHLPSLPIGVHLARRAATPRPWAARPDLGLVAPAFSDAARERWDLPALEHGADHARALLGIWGGTARARVLTGADATLESLDSAAGRLRTLHVFTHGVQLPDELRRAAAVLAPSPMDELWTAERVDEEWAADLSAPQLVTLGVCRLGRGLTRLGDDGVDTLGTTLLAAGSEVVVLAEHPLEEVATSRLLERFYRELGRGDAGGPTPAEALRAARAALRADPHFAHPADWGLVAALGLGHRRLVRKGRRGSAGAGRCSSRRRG